MARIPRLVFFAVVVRFVVLVLLGLNVRHRERLPASGPAIILANHNSHLDTMVLMSLLPLRLLPRIRPVAAKDYFLRNRVLAWFATRIIGILPIARGPAAARSRPLAGCIEALGEGQILILFPEGTRGEPEKLAAFKAGVARLAQSRPETPVIPVYLHGLGKALPRGEGLLVPFICDVFVGDALRWNGNRRAFLAAAERAMEALAGEGAFRAWE